MCKSGSIAGDAYPLYENVSMEKKPIRCHRKPDSFGKTVLSFLVHQSEVNQIIPSRCNQQWRLACLCQRLDTQCLPGAPVHRPLKLKSRTPFHKVYHSLPHRGTG